MRVKLMAAVFAPVMVAGLCLTAGAVHAGTKYQTSLVPVVDVAPDTPAFSAKGSSIKIDGKKLRLKGKIKNVVDALGDRITTDGVPSADDYSVEVDLSVPATPASGTVTVFFDLKNGNGKFRNDDISGNAAFAGSELGDGVAVEAVRVKDGDGNVIGSGGFSVSQ